MMLPKIFPIFLFCVVKVSAWYSSAFSIPHSIIRYGSGTYSPRYPYNVNNNLINQRYPNIPSKNLNPPYRQQPLPPTTVLYQKPNTVVSLVPLSPVMPSVRSLSTPSMRTSPSVMLSSPSQNISPALQFPPQSVPTEFKQALSNHGTLVRDQHASGGSFAYSSPGASAYAYSSLGPTNLFNQHQQIWNDWKNGQYANSVPYAPPSYAYGTSYYGPSGFQQTASIYPPNPNSPNINKQYAANTNNGGNNGHFYGVQTASFSHSANLNGVQTNRKAAYTTVNDNGKITTYRIGS